MQLISDNCGSSLTQYFNVSTIPTSAIRRAVATYACNDLIGQYFRTHAHTRRCIITQGVIDDSVKRGASMDSSILFLLLFINFISFCLFNLLYHLHYFLLEHHVLLQRIHLGFLHFISLLRLAMCRLCRHCYWYCLLYFVIAIDLH